MLLTPAGAISTFSSASPQAEAITNLFWISIWILAAILVIVFGLVGYIVVRFRGREGDPEPTPLHGNTRLEVGWTIVPLVIVGILCLLNAQVMLQTNPPVTRGEEPEILVVGHQWWWEVQYPKAGVVTANEVHVPVGRKILVRLKSADVIHDFWVPELGPKIDVLPEPDNLPGPGNHLYLEPRNPGVYVGACAEFCGDAHAWMRFLVVAEPEAEYQAWLAAQANPPAAPDTPEAWAGAQLFQEMACLNCHQYQGQPGNPDYAPELTTLSSRRQLGAGVLENSPASLAAWLKDPQKYKPGCKMPDFNLSDQQVQALVAYLWRAPR